MLKLKSISLKKPATSISATKPKPPTATEPALNPALTTIEFLAEAQTYDVMVLTLPAVLADRDRRIAIIDHELSHIDHRLDELYLRRNDITTQAGTTKGVAA